MEYYILDAPDWVNVIALTEDEHVVLIEQFRHGTRQMTWEIPGGAVDPGESPRDAAARELLEETGYTADEFILLGTVRPNPAFLTNVCHTFLGRCARRTHRPSPDPGEEIRTWEAPLKEIPRFIAEGRIDHALVIAAFQWYWLKRGSGTPTAVSR